MSEFDNLPASTPTLVAWAAVDQHEDDHQCAREPVVLMIDATRQAAARAGGEALLQAVQRISVPQGMWGYRDPARLVAQAIGAPQAHTEYAKFGILQQTLMADACQRIQAGELEVALVVGGEAKYRDLRANIAGQQASLTQQDETVTPDTTLEPDAELWLAAENNAGLGMAVGYYAILESALRAARGQSIKANRRHLGELYARFSAIAANNPDAWRREVVSAEYLREPSAKNPMLAFPYTKLMNTSWNVDQAAALVFCSVGKARALGIPPAQWIFPLGASESNHMLAVSQRRKLAEPQAVRLMADALAQGTGISPASADLIDLYSCFPVAVELVARGLSLPEGRDLTITGGMAFAGGPLNNYLFQSTCRAADLLQQGRGKTALLSSVSGMFTKQALGLWSKTSPLCPFSFSDVSALAEACDAPLEVRSDAEGEGVIVGYTVLFERGEPARLVAVIDLPDGSRAVAANTDAALMQRLMQEEGVGLRVQVSGGVFGE